MRCIIWMHYVNAWLKRRVFNLDLNSESVSEPRTLSGRLFQSLGAKYEKALPPLVDFAILTQTLTQTQPLNIIMTSLINHSQSVRYSHSLSSTSYWQCHLHTSLSVFWYLIFLFIFLRLLLHVNHVQPICTFLSCTVMLILYLGLQYTIMHIILYFVLYIFFFFFIHFILCILLCVVFYNIALSMERTWLTFHCWLILSV